MNKKRILVVDDEASLRETISELLIEKKYSVMTAENGYEAIVLLEYWTPDLIISDIMMPVMDGYEFQGIVKENELLSHIPFIFLSAKNGEAEKEKCMLNGVDLFVTKPFKIENLIKIINVKIERFEKITNAYNTLNNSAHFSHEIKTPLSGILGSINHLIERKDSFQKNEIDMFYNSIKTSGEVLNRTLKNAILYSDLKKNALEFLNDSSSKILDEFEKVKDGIAKTNEIQSKRIICKIVESNIKIEAEYLHFILFELINNALKFSKINKRIVIEGKKYNDEFYELKIQNYGVGFSQKEIKEIKANQQFDRDDTEQQGLGLGLYLCMTFVKKIRGVFSINSQKNVGTTIIIYFPLHNEKLK